MPDVPETKIRPHPGKAGPLAPIIARAASAPTAYAELAITTNYTFLTGASQPEEMVQHAAALGHAAAAIADRNTLAGIVRAHVAAKESGIPLAVGCRLSLIEPAGFQMLVFPTCREAYARLCTLLTLGKRRAPKGECYLSLHDFLDHEQGMLAIALPPRTIDDDYVAALRGLRDRMNDDRLSLGASCALSGRDAQRLRQIDDLSRHTRVPMLAHNDAHYHDPARRPLQDVLTCIRHGCTIHEAGRRLHANAERRLKSPAEMAALFARHPHALSRAAQVALRAAAFSLDELRYEYPAPDCPPAVSPTQHLRQLTAAGALRRYPRGVPEKVQRDLDSELALIEELKYEAYFLTCHDIVDFARSRGILCQGRGGAANSAVCYCLGITEVNPATFSLLFARFVSRERREPPDIDIDFEHERREEVIQHLYAKYGREHAALTAEVITYRGRSAVRDVGKAMGLSADCIDSMARNLSRWPAPPEDERDARTLAWARDAGIDPTEPTIRATLELANQIAGFPRHLSQHVGGFVITRSPLSHLVPIENAAMEDRTVIEWDKDDIDAMGMLKVDVLGLGMLTCIRKSLELIGPTLGEPRTDALYARIATDPTDQHVYEMIQRADTIGVFQIESRAQMSMLPRLKPEVFYDLVIEVAIVRPGPIQGGMVHPYLRRRSGEEPVTFPRPEIEDVLGRTLGVPLFQEQAMQIAIVAAGFTPDEADALRRAMAAWRRKGDKILAFGRRLIDGMIANGYPREFAERCFEQIKGFSEYGFPESHAASFALLVYVSCWLKRHHPAAFGAALINSQPMGFYAPAQIVRDLRDHGVTVREVDVNRSRWDCTLEWHGRPGHESGMWHGRPGHEQAETPTGGTPVPQSWGLSGPAVRLGMRLVRGLSEQQADRIAAAVRTHGPFNSIAALHRISGASVSALRCLARADAFASMGMDRQAALWQVRALRDERLPLFDGAETDDEGDGGGGAADLPAFAPGRHVLQDYAHLGLSLRAHPVSFMRATLHERGAACSEVLRDQRACPQGTRITVAGVVLVRQRPGTASGVVFATLEDETGTANLVIWPRVFERFRKIVRLSAVMLATGRVERQGEVVHVHADHVECLDHLVPELVSRSRDFH
ncbi:MAG: error-prone DNA polymerase [Phycisphaeraceae bacterium]|nr:error-prone DNA polymerase [Phycisphaeraceae bacterium]